MSDKERHKDRTRLIYAFVCKERERERDIKHLERDRDSDGEIK